MIKQDLFLLSREQLWGSEKGRPLSIFDTYGTKCAVTDYVILLGGYVSDDTFSPEGNLLEYRTGLYWTTTSAGGGSTYISHKDGSEDWSWVYLRRCAIRPIISYASLKPFVTLQNGYLGIEEIIYGEYPQMAVSGTMQDELERLFDSAELKTTGKQYTADSKSHDDYDSEFSPIYYDEYEHEKNKYIRVEANSDFGDKEFTLSNGLSYKNGMYIWVEVKPVKWMIDIAEGIAVSQKALLAGIRFNPRDVYIGEFSFTEIKEYLNRYMSNEIIPPDIHEQNTEKKTRENPYGFNFTQASEEDIIRGAIQSDITPFIHGLPSEGKSARVKQIDPDCEIIYLRNATPEYLNGKCVYDTETKDLVDIKPTWLKKICRKCEEEPEKIHILFFDELTNATYSIQCMAFNIVLDKEVNGIWKLPVNCKIVAAGNDLNDSLAANVLAEPLFNRFAHIYVETSSKKWLRWAITADRESHRLQFDGSAPPHRIHPAIYAYISYRGDRALRSEYTGEKPNADPRKWEFASRLLYKTNRPDMIRALVGEKAARDFMHFCNQQVITLNDVLSKKYSESDLDMTLPEKYALIYGLSRVDESGLEIIREFIIDIEEKLLNLFDVLWSYGNENRLNDILEIKKKNGKL